MGLRETLTEQAAVLDEKIQRDIAFRDTLIRAGELLDKGADEAEAMGLVLEGGLNLLKARANEEAREAEKV